MKKKVNASRRRQKAEGRRQRVESPWFRERMGKKDGWSFVPLNWKGWVALIVLLAVNVFAAWYFNLNYLVLDNWLSMGVVFLLSIFVFIEIAKRRTRGLVR